MKISDVQALLSKVSNVAGDVELVLKAVEGEAETVIHSVGIELGAAGDATSAAATITHGPAPEAPAESNPATVPEDAPPAPAV